MSDERIGLAIIRVRQATEGWGNQDFVEDVRLLADHAEAFITDRTPAWLGMTNVDEVQDLIWADHADVIDVSKMEPVWVTGRIEEDDSE